MSQMGQCNHLDMIRDVTPSADGTACASALRGSSYVDDVLLPAAAA